MKKFTLLTLSLFMLCAGFAQNAEQVTSVGDPGSGIIYPSQELVEQNGQLFFHTISSATVNQAELWTTDGTTAGTQLVKGIDNVGDRFGVLSVTAAGNQVFFTLDDGIHGRELWKTDGTTNGTVMVKDIFTGPGASSPTLLTELNGVLYFFTYEDGTGRDLWRSDGTAHGTQLVRSFPSAASDSSLVDRLTVAGGKLFFKAQSGSGNELWVSDGTTAGTFEVKDIFPGPNSSRPLGISEVNGMVIFVAGDAINGRALWKSDGTASGTVMVKDFDLLQGVPPSIINTFQAEAVNADFYFSREINNRTQLWKSDGSETGTVMVADFPVDVEGGIRNLVGFNGELYFSALSTAFGHELWKSDGTTAGTIRLSDVNPGAANGFAYDLTVFKGEVYFGAFNATEGAVIWKTDGTPSGTTKVSGLSTGTYAYKLVGLTEFNNSIYFFGAEVTSGAQIWKLKDNVISVAENALESGISVGPNPSYDVFRIQSNAPVSEVLVTDLQGRTVAVSVKNNALDLSQHPTGIYLLRGVVDGRAFSTKLIKL